MAMGGLDQVDFAFTDIRMELDSGKKKNGNNGDKTRLLLDGSISGRAKPGRMLAIMGPSGAGKVRKARMKKKKKKCDDRETLFPSVFQTLVVDAHAQIGHPSLPPLLLLLLFIAIINSQHLCMP